MFPRPLLRRGYSPRGDVVERVGVEVPISSRTGTGADDCFALRDLAEPTIGMEDWLA
jgi:hypothetical protein